MDWYYHIHLPTLSSLDSMLPHHNHHPRLSTVLSDPKSWPSSTIVPVVRQLKMLSLPTTKLCPGAAQPWDPIPSYSSSPDLSATTEEVVELHQSLVLAVDGSRTNAKSAPAVVVTDDGEASFVATSMQEEFSLEHSHDHHDRRRRRLQGFSTASLGGRSGPSCDPAAPVKARQVRITWKP
eukprot:1192152-Prorocentrum_minimum.AAC.5